MDGDHGEAGSTAEPPRPEIDSDAQVLARLEQEAQRLRAYYQGQEMPPEITELLGYVEGHRIADIRRSLTPIYQRLAPQGKMPEPLIDRALAAG